LVIQFGHGWAGNSTFFINDEKELKTLKQSYGKIKVKITRYVSGITVLNIAVVLPKSILQSPAAVQIKSRLDLTRMKGGTGGRQWPVDLTGEQEKTIKEITQKTGEIMRTFGYKGFFGLDFLIDQKTNRVYLSENNARLTASSSFYTHLELGSNQFPLLGYHLLCFVEPKLLENIFSDDRKEVFGSEIIGRNTNFFPVRVVKNLLPGIYDFRLNLKKESDWLNSEKEDFWLTTAEENRLVNPEIEIFKINSFEKVADNQGNLTEKFDLVVKKIGEMLITQKA
jgi:hypothetical protein